MHLSHEIIFVRMILFCCSFGRLHDIVDKRHTNSTGDYDLWPSDCVDVRVRKFYGLQKRLVLVL